MTERSTMDAASTGEPGYIYHRIEGHLRRRIHSRELKPGDRLPSENELSRDFNTTRVTASKALDALEREGLVRRLVGRGTFVASPPPVTSAIDTRLCRSFEEQVGLTGKTVDYRLLRFERVLAPDFARRLLGLPNLGEIYRFERLRLVDAQVVGLELRYIPPDISARVTAPMLAERSVLEFMGELLGRQVATIAVTVVAEIADDDLSHKLEVPVGSAVTVREHVYRDHDGRVVLCGRNYFRGDVRLVYVLGPLDQAPG